MNSAFIFPGQGSQIVGMGKDLYLSYPIAKETFDLVNDTLKFNLTDIIFNGPETDLTLTTNAQAAIMAVSMAFMRVIVQQSQRSFSELCQYTAGHSLGEYTALAAAGAIDLATTANLLKIRSTAMQNANLPNTGAMAACIGIELKALEDILKIISLPGVCEIANDNILGQIVISGDHDSIDRVVAILKDGNYRAIKLNVSAAFHSSLMKSAEIKMLEALSEVEFLAPSVPVIQNFIAEVSLLPAMIKQNLVNQVCGKVRWRETLQLLEDRNVSKIVEVGPSKVLTSMMKKTKHNFTTVNISNIAELDHYLSNR